MAQAGTVWVNVRGNTAPLTADVSAAARHLGGSMSSLTRTVASDITRTTAQVTAGFATLGAVGTASLLKVGAGYNTLEQSSLAAFETLLGTRDAAVEMQDTLRDFARSSPFPRQAFIEGTQQLLAFGFEAEKIIPTLDAVQNAVAAAGGGAADLDQIIGVLAKIRSTGSFSVRELQQLGQAGINAGKLIAEQLGVTEQEFQESFLGNPARGQEAIALLDTLVAGMTDQFGGAAENLKETFVGARDRIAGAWRDIGSDLVEPFISKAGGGYAVEWANDVADGMRSLQRNVIPALEAPIDRVAGRLSSAADAASSLVANISPARAVSAVRSVERGVESLRSTLAGAEGVAVGVGVAVAGLGARTVLGPLGFLVPAISPVTGALAGVVAGSKDGRAALRGLGDQGREFAAGPGRELLGSFAGFVSELEGPVVRAISGVGGGILDLATRGAPLLARGLDDVGPPLGRLIDSGTKLAVEVLDRVGDLAGVTLPPLLGVLSSGLGVAASGMELLADNSWLVVPALAAIATSRSWDRLSGLGSGIVSSAQAVGRSVGDFQTYFRVLRAEGQSVRGSFSGAAREAGGFGGVLGKLNPVLIGVTAAVGLGTIAYQRYAENKGRVTDATSALVAAMKKEREEFRQATTTRLRDVFADKDALDALNQMGMSLTEVSELAALYGDDLRRLNGLWGATPEIMERFAPPVRAVADELTRLVEAGEISPNEAIRFLESLDEAAQSTAESMSELRSEARSIAQEAFADGIINAQQLEQILSDIAAAKTPTQLNDAFQNLSGLLGETRTGAEKARDALRDLLDTLNELVGADRDVDEASRRYEEAIDRLAQSFLERGPGLTGEDGRANADAILRAVEGAERLAEAQARIDLTGESSRRTLQRMAESLAFVRDQGGLTADDYERLIRLYGLTPERIETTVSVATGQAEAKVDEIRAKLAGLDQEDPTVVARIEAMIDDGSYAEAETTLEFLRRVREAEIKAQVDVSAAEATFGGWAAEVLGFTLTPKVDADTDPAREKVASWWDLVTGRMTVAPVDANTDPAVTRWQGLRDTVSGSTLRSPFDLDTEPARRSLRDFYRDVGGLDVLGFLGFDSGRVRGQALGGALKPGWTIVGEHGPEAMHVAAGTVGSVVPTPATMSMLTGGTAAQQVVDLGRDKSVSVDGRSGDPALASAVARLERTLAAMPTAPTVHATFNEVEKAPTVDDLVWMLNVVPIGMQ